MLAAVRRRHARARSLFTAAALSAAAIAGAAINASPVSASLPLPPVGPVVEALQPTGGPAEGGNRVVLSGTLITNASEVAFGPEPAAIVERSASTITVIAPPGLSGTTVQVVADPGRYYRNSTSSPYTYAGRTRSAVTLSPARGTPLGGNEVTISGAGIDFAGAKAVTFGGKPAPIVRSSPTSVIVRAPAGAPRSKVQVTVRTADGNFEGVQQDLYTYSASAVPPTITSVSPTSSNSIWDVITIKGSAFEEVTDVKIDGESVYFSAYASGDEITFRPPRHAPGKVDIEVTTTAGTSANTPNDDFTYLPVPDPPVVDTVTPGTVYESDKPELVIRGRNLAETVYVYIINTESDITYRSDTEIRVRPESLFIPGTYRVTVLAPGGATTNRPDDPTDDLTILNDPPGPAPKPLTLSPNHSGGVSTPVVVLSGGPSDIDWAKIYGVKIGEGASERWAEILDRTPTSVTIRIYSSSLISSNPEKIRVISSQADRRQLNTDQDLFTWDDAPDPTPDPTPSPSPDPTPSPSPTPSPTPTPIPTPEPIVGYGYSVTGSATLATLTKGSVSLAGSLKAKVVPSARTFTGDLVLPPASAKLTALGFLPVTAKIAFVSTEPLAGTFADGNLLARTKVRVKLPSVKLYGLELAGGASCQTRQVSALTLKSARPFVPSAGGLLTGAFAISDLVGCGGLTGIVSPLTKGGGNAIALNLAPTA